VQGATVTGVDYNTYGGSAGLIDSIALVFSNTPDDSTVALTASGGAGGQGTFDCGDVADGASTCTYTPVAAEHGYNGLTGISITVDTQP
jgi:hypothetical protein